MAAKTKNGAWIEEEDHAAIVLILDDAVYAFTNLPKSARNSTAWRDAVQVAYRVHMINLKVDADPDVVADVLEEIDPRLKSFPEVPQ